MEKMMCIPYSEYLDERGKRRKLEKERDEFERLANEWMNEHEKLRSKYEPEVAVISESER